MMSSLFLYLLIFTTTHSLLYTVSDVIYDIAGNKLLRGIPYYILPLLRGSGGGLTLSGEKVCLFDVTQEAFELNHGVPFTFNPIFLDEEFIRASYPTSIEAAIEDPCRGSKILKVSEAAAAAKNDAETITTGGKLNTPESCFQIVEVDVLPRLRSYQIQYCPSKCGSSSTTSLSCYNVGVVSGAGGKKYLALTGAVFPVVFASSFHKFSESATL